MGTTVISVFILELIADAAALWAHLNKYSITYGPGIIYPLSVSLTGGSAISSGRVIYYYSTEPRSIYV